MSPYAGGWSSRSCLGWGLGVPGMTANEDEEEDDARVSSRGERDRERSEDADGSSGDDDEEVPSTFKMTILCPTTTSAPPLSWQIF